jgi:hypothetical protein
MQSVVGRCQCCIKKPFQRAPERFFVSDREVEVGRVRNCAASYSASPDTPISQSLAVMQTGEGGNVRHVSRNHLQPPPYLLTQ